MNRSPSPSRKGLLRLGGARRQRSQREPRKGGDHPYSPSRELSEDFRPGSVFDAPMERSGRWDVPRREVGIRPYPFPFAAAFALSNENSYASAELFQEVHRFINGRGATPFGDSLGLEISDSLTVGPNGALNIAADLADDGSIRHLLGVGWLDQIFCPDPARVHAVISALDHLEAPPPVWLGATAVASRTVLAARGVRWFCDDTLVERDKFGDHQDHKTAERFHQAARRYDWGGLPAAFFQGRFPQPPDALAKTMNSTIICDDSDGGARFKRYRGPFLPSMPGFSGQVTSFLLDQLVLHRAAVIVQQQLGRWALIGAAAGREQVRANASPALDRHAIAAWREIADRNAAGQIWVATVSRLLEYLSRRETREFRVEKSMDRWVIFVDGPRIGAGAVHKSASADLNGLAFTVPQSAPEVILTPVGARAPLPCLRAADPVHRALDAVYLPWRALEWPLAADR